MIHMTHITSGQQRVEAELVWIIVFCYVLTAMANYTEVRLLAKLRIKIKHFDTNTDNRQMGLSPFNQSRGRGM